ncbi:MAG: pseudouridine synthase, partial [Bryobacteraceae bacterium]
TLDRALSRLGFCSRTEAAAWIRAGRVRVNGRPQTEPETWVEIGRDRITVDGKPLFEGRKRYLLLYKPKGYLTTWRDPQGRPTVYDLIGETRQWIFPVGRLDMDTSGLLLMTNDSGFAERMTNPGYHVPKTYLVKTATLLDDAQLAALRQGVELKDGPTRPAEVVRLRDRSGRTFLEITITEGRNRQVRRMIEAVGSKVLKLVRTAIGPVRIGKLAIGRWRELTADEVRSLLQCARSGARRAAREASRRTGPPQAV